MKDQILKYLNLHPWSTAREMAQAFFNDATYTRPINSCLYHEMDGLWIRRGNGFALTDAGKVLIAQELPTNHGKSWVPEDIERLRQMVHDYWDIERIANSLGRSVNAIEWEMNNIGLEYAEEPVSQEENVYQDAFDDETVSEQPKPEQQIEEPEIPQLSERQIPVAKKLIEVIPENAGITLTTLVFTHEFDSEEIQPILEILRQQDVLRYDRMNRLWFVQDRKKVQESVAEPEQQIIVEPEPEEPQEPTVEQVYDIVAASVETINLCARYGERQYLAARYRITRNGQNDAYWLATTDRMLNADHDVRSQLGAHIAYKNSLMGVCLQTTEVGKNFVYVAPAGRMENHVHNTHVLHTREIHIENEEQSYNYRQYASLDAYLQLLQQNQRERERKEAEIRQKELERQNENLTPVEKGQLTREINKGKEEMRQLAGQRDDLLMLSNYIREQGKLRYNPILDRIQTRIKTEHLYDGVPLVIDGGPGTGKTTTMIQRLKYLTDIKAIEEDFNEHHNRFHLSREQREDLFNRIKNNHDWTFFSPSRLLKLYLADAMSKDGLVDPQNKVKDWVEFRTMALRNYGFFGFGKSFPFIDCPESKLLIYPDATPRKQFIDFLKNSISKEVALLPTIDSTHIIGMSNNARRIVAELNGIEHDSLRGIIQRLSRLEQIQLERTVDIDDDLEQLADLLELEVVKDDILVELLSEIQLQDDDIEYEGTDEKHKSDLHYLLKNWLHAYCYDRFYPSEEHSSEYNDILALLNDIVKKIDTARLNRIGDGFIYERYHIFTKGVSKIILQRLPKYFKAFRRFILEQNNTEEWNVELLKNIIKQDKKQLHFQEQALLLLITNDLICTINKALPNHMPRHKYIDAYNDLVRPIIGIDEVTDFSEVEIQSIVSFALQDYNSITMAGDLMQRLTVGGITSWDALDNAVLDKNVVELRTSYRQSKRMLEVAQQLYEDTIGQRPNYKAHMQENKVPRPWMYVSDSENQKIQWIEKRIAEVYRAYGNQLPATAIFLNSKEDVTPFVEKMRSLASIQNAGVKIVDGSSGDVQGTNQEIRVYPIDIVKGLEFDVVFFHNIDSAGFDNDTIKRYIYVGVSRAAFFLAATMTQDNQDISQYFSKQKNWRNFTDDETNS